MKLIKYKTKDELMSSLAEIVSKDIKEEIINKSKASLVVAGGNTPKPFFKQLKLKDIKWNKLSIMLSDERKVDESSPFSNTALVKKYLLNEESNFISILDKKIKKNFFPISSCVLGMGDDMHTASLFPNNISFKNSIDDIEIKIIDVKVKDNEITNRVSLNPYALKQAKNTHILICGDAKMKALKKASKIKDILQAPINLILEKSCVHYAD